MIRAFIFSRDRALQLEATVRSFRLHCADSAQVHLTALYSASKTRLQHQYARLQSMNPHIDFIRQGDFRQGVLDWLNPYPGESFSHKMFHRLQEISRAAYAAGRWPRRFFRILAGRWFHLVLPDPGEECILFLTDDSIFVRDFSMWEVVAALRANPDSIGFSLRLGKNTTYSYMQAGPQPLPDFRELPENILKYGWPTAAGDFGYPLELSSSAYRARDIAPYVLGLAFQNPNALESEMWRRKDRFAGKSSSLMCFAQSVAFSAPVNMVQDSFPHNRAAQKYAYSADELARRFDAGERIRVEAYDGFVPSACHQEVELIFEQAERSVP